MRARTSGKGSGTAGGAAAAGSCWLKSKSRMTDEARRRFCIRSPLLDYRDSTTRVVLRQAEPLASGGAKRQTTAQEENRMVGIPERNEAADYYYKYIDRITSPDIVGVFETQLGE